MRNHLFVMMLLLLVSAPAALAQQPAAATAPEEAEEEKEPLSPSDQHYQDGILLLQKGAIQEGLAKINQALEADEYHGPSLLLMGEVSLQQGDEEKAKEYFRKIIKGVGGKARKDADDYFHLGTANYYLEDYQGTIFGLEKAISMNVDVELKMMIPMLFSAAVKLDVIDRAIRYAKKYVEIEPENQQALMTLLSALFQQQNYAEAEVYALQLVDIDPENTEALKFLAMSQFYQQKYNDTILNAAKALNRGDTSSELHYMLAVSFFEGEVYFQAIGLFKKYLESAPDDYGAWLYLGQCHQGIGEYEKAEEAYDKAMDLKPEDPYVHYQLGTLYEFGYKKMRGALPHYRTALSLARKAANQNLVAALEERIDVVEYESNWWPWK